VTRLSVCPGCRAAVLPIALDAPSGRCPSCDLAVIERQILADQGGEFGIFERAARKVKRPDGTVHMSDLRPLLKAIPPKHHGTLVRRAKVTGLLVEAGIERSDDVSGKNAGRPEPYYRLAS
jgi:hypothetical protein